MTARVVIDDRAIAELLSDPQVVAGIGEVADRIADEMARRAPRRTGAAAASIHAEPAPNPADGFRVSWDRRHFYLSFANSGTADEQAQHFVEDALSSFRG